MKYESQPEEIPSTPLEEPMLPDFVEPGPDNSPEPGPANDPEPEPVHTPEPLSDD
ncbi:hypothetical protein [Legionella tunisiensis]|uniref:hypothetical protein n=1 Tax=Legionella tunisiensis TaxID=1034944 RepID=UPI0002E5052D|nr:hypothetical protein [Legionella tunisiensis]